MSDAIKHECGLALIRLLKPLSYYQEKYGTSLYGVNKLHLLMQKQRNRGQDGAGIATIKLDPKPGRRYISRKRSNSPQYLKDLFQHVFDYYNDLSPKKMADTVWLKKHTPFMGELLLGHLRYGTHGINNIESVHPFLRQSNWISRNLVLAGNFNLTNVHELINELVSLGQFPKEKSDTVTMLEKIGHFLDDEVERLYTWYKRDGFKNTEINKFIARDLDIQRLLQRASKKFDGGYVMAGLIGHGDAFVMRDPLGIRPAFWYADDEIVAVASERPALQTAFDVPFGSIHEVQRGHALIIKKSGLIKESPFIKQQKNLPCSFERIYFSRGTDRDIYTERKKLGEQLAKKIIKKGKLDFKHTVFSYVPNTAETAFLGMIEGLNNVCKSIQKKKIIDLQESGQLTSKKLEKILSIVPRVEKIVVKDAKIRTFIADDKARGELVNHIYDVTYGIVENHVDTLVLMDDSIVRGTTLRDSIIQITGRLKPKKILIVSSAPQIRFPDCYGIDMSRMSEFVAFRALVELLNDTDQMWKLDDVYDKCRAQLKMPIKQHVNHVKPLYKIFSTEKISHKIAELVTPKGFDIPVEIVFQSLGGLHEACPDHGGDWYFSGDYPTPGGNKTVNLSFMRYMEQKEGRSYEYA